MNPCIFLCSFGWHQTQHKKVNVFRLSIKNSSNGIFGLLACAICFILFCVFIFSVSIWLFMQNDININTLHDCRALLLLRFFLLCCWTLNLSYFSGAHLFVTTFRLSTQTHSPSSWLCLSNFSFSLCVFACVRAIACTVVYFTVLCGQRHLLYEQFQLHRILWSNTHTLSEYVSLSSYAFSHTLVQQCVSVCISKKWSRLVECVRAHVSCASFDFSLMQSTLLEKHTTLRWSSRYS